MITLNYRGIVKATNAFCEGPFGLRTVTTVGVQGCATGTGTMGEGLEIIRRGAADVMIVGGTDGRISAPATGGFCAMQALFRRSRVRALRSFDFGVRTPASC
jgi:3-oxoacyl-[acyl-carrier-protein] synthase II